MYFKRKPKCLQGVPELVQLIKMNKKSKNMNRKNITDNSNRKKSEHSNNKKNITNSSNKKNITDNKKKRKRSIMDNNISIKKKEKMNINKKKNKSYN